jgi:hypothetical protein
MAPTAAQFSPGQILEAGRRAENDGRVGYAIQFYRHLTDHHGWSPEAAIAKEALARLANFRPTAEPPANGQGQHANPAPSWPASGQAQAQSQPGHGPAVQHGANNGGYPQASPNGVANPFPTANPVGRALQPAQPQMQQQTAPSGLHLPPPERRYRIGSIVAWLLLGIGLTLMAGSLVLVGLHAVGLKVPGTLGMMLGFTGGLPGALALFAVGVTQVFAVQIGRALFDSANATRDLAMIERAKIAHAAGERPFSEDDEPV